MQKRGGIVTPPYFFISVEVSTESHYKRIVKTVQLSRHFKDLLGTTIDDNQETIQLEWTELVRTYLQLRALYLDGTLRFICLATVLGCSPLFMLGRNPD